MGERGGKLNRGHFRLLLQFGCFTGPAGITGSSVPFRLALSLASNRASMGKLWRSWDSLREKELPVFRKKRRAAGLLLRT